MVGKVTHFIPTWFHRGLSHELGKHKRSKTKYTSVKTKETLSPVWQWTSPKYMVTKIEVQRVNTPSTFPKSATEQAMNSSLRLSCVHSTDFSWLTFQFVWYSYKIINLTSKVLYNHEFSSNN